MRPGCTLTERGGMAHAKSEAAARTPASVAMSEMPTAEDAPLEPLDVLFAPPLSVLDDNAPEVDDDPLALLVVVLENEPLEPDTLTELDEPESEPETETDEETDTEEEIVTDTEDDEPEPEPPPWRSAS